MAPPVAKFEPVPVAPPVAPNGLSRSGCPGLPSGVDFLT